MLEFAEAVKTLDQLLINEAAGYSNGGALFKSSRYPQRICRAGL
jgi:hypothetical protein